MKRSQSLFTRLLSVQLAVVLIALLTVGLSLSYLYTQYIFDQKQKEMIAVGKRVSTFLTKSGVPRIFTGPVIANDLSFLSQATQVYGDTTWVIDGTGTIVFPDELRGYTLDSSVTEAVLSGNIVTRRIFLQQLGEPTYSVAVPIVVNSAVQGAIMVHSPMRGVTQTIQNARRFIFWTGVAAALLAAMVSYLFARRVAEPLQEMRSVALDMAGGNFSRRVQVTGGDEVSELAAALNNMAGKLDTTIKALAEEKSKVESVVTGLSEGVLALDKDGRIHLLNEAAQQLLSPVNLNPGSVLESTAELGELGDQLTSAFSQVLDGFGRQQFTIDSADRSILVQIAPLSDPDPAQHGENLPVGAVALLRDVSEAQRLEKMRRDFVADVSHELRTPLTSIRGFAQAILEEVVNKKEDVHRYLGIIMSESMRLMRLTNTLLDLSRLDAHRVKLQLAPVRICDLVTDALSSLEPIIAEKSVTTTKDMQEQLPEIAGDPDRLEQVLVNLLDNAIRHAPEGGEVRLQATCAFDWLEIRIEDNGPGIPPAELPFIWERFYKVDKARRQNRTGGTGLGLVIVKQIVELHGGSVRAENAPDGGARFVVKLPVTGPEPEPQSAERYTS